MTGADPAQFTTPFAITPSTHRDPYPAISPENNPATNKIIIITGASSGIGAAAAKVWARAHAQGIVITGRRQALLNTVAEELKRISPSTTVVPVVADSTSEAAVKELFTTVYATFGKHADVIINSVGYLSDAAPIGEMSVDEYWKGFEINFKGLYSVLHHYIAAQKTPKPTGTFITVSSGRAGLTMPGGSSYNISKLAEQRLIEHAQLEYPGMRFFSTMPGIVVTELSEKDEFWAPFAKDHAELTGMQALWLSDTRADFLKGAMVSVNWDVEELEEAKEEIVEKKALWTSWLPILPYYGGKGLESLR